MIQNPSSLALSYIRMWNKHEKNWFQHKIPHTHTCTRIYIKYIHTFFSRTGGCESALFALLFTHSLFWHMHWLARKKINDKTQLSASFPWGNQKTKKNKKTTLSQALWPSRSSWFSCFFLVCQPLTYWKFFWLLAKFPRWHEVPSIKSHLSLHKVTSFCTVPLHKGVQHLFDMNPKSLSKRQLCKAPLKK